MARELNTKDIEIMRKLAPELEDVICRGSGLEYRSILPPTANHFATDDLDFAQRLDRLTKDELMYLMEMIKDGRESLGCLQEESAEVFIAVVQNNLSREDAALAREIYEAEGGCDT
jgi:hypothetical protein